MKHTLVCVALLSCCIASAQTIFVFPFAATPLPTNCGGIPFQFQQAFRFYVNT